MCGGGEHFVAVGVVQSCERLLQYESWMETITYGAFSLNGELANNIHRESCRTLLNYCVGLCRQRRMQGLQVASES